MSELTPAQETILAKVKEVAGGNLLHTDNSYGFLTVTIRKDTLLPLVTALFEDEGLRFRFLTTMCGLHYPDQKEELGLMVQLHSLENNYRIRLKTFFTRDQAHLPTLTGLFKGANWMEREAFDFYGIEFKGHPDMRRILNVEDMIMHPMRKEFPLEDQVRLDKNDKMFGR
jgi:NADH-quinone oxidoreductase subunit C